MTDYEKVMRGLDCCAADDSRTCKKCPYAMIANGVIQPSSTCTMDLTGDALDWFEKYKWIPATNPPKENGRYLVTILEHGEYISAEAVFFESVGIWADPVEEYEHYNHVVAWMPLPEPYKPKEEDDGK